MAIDTAQRRVSASSIALGMFGPIIVPDGSLTQPDRQSAAMLYPGILAGDSAPAPEVAATVVTGGWPDYRDPFHRDPFHKTYRKRYKIETEEEEEAVEIVEKVVERVVKAEPDTKQKDVELAIRMALKSNEIIYKALYLQIAIEEMERLQKQREMMIEDENTIILFAVMN